MNNFYGGNDQNNSFSGTQIMSQQGGGGGGGFLNTSTMADMVGGGGGDTTDMGMGQEQQSFNVSEPCLLPCTIKQILNAPAPSQDETLKVDGKELNSVTIVGKIININVESTHVTYEIDDGTGQLDVSLWTAGSGNNDNSNDNNNNNNNSNNNRNDDFKSDLVNDCYVRCIGKIKTYKDNRSMTGYMIRRIEDFNEITYHNLEVLHTHLINIHGNRAKEILRNQNKYQNSSNSNDNNNNNSYQNNNNNNNNYNGNNGYNNRGNNNNNNNNFNNFNNNNNNGFNNNNNNNNSGSNNNNNNFNNGNFNNNNNNNDNSFNNGGNNGNNNFNSNFNNNNGNNNSMMVSNFNSSNNNGDAEGESALARKLLTFLQECEKNANENYDGCYVDRIFEALKDEDRNEVKELLEHLSSDGKIFTTVDEEHYRLS